MPMPSPFKPHMPRQAGSPTTKHGGRPENIPLQQTPEQTSEQPLYPPQNVPGNTVQPTNQVPVQPTVQPPVQPQPVVSQPSNPYDFIINPTPPPSKLALGASSAVMRVVLVAGGLVVLLIAFVFIKGLLGGGSNFTSFITVAQDQQELIHLASNASLQKDLSVINQNFAATATLSLNTSQSNLFTYLRTNKVKVNPKALNKKLDLTLDKQLTTAAAAATYNQTFKEIMGSQLNTYISDLQQAFDKVKGEKGHALLSDDYDQAKLLLEQLNTPAS